MKEKFNSKLVLTNITETKSLNKDNEIEVVVRYSFEDKESGVKIAFKKPKSKTDEFFDEMFVGDTITMNLVLLQKRIVDYIENE